MRFLFSIFLFQFNLVSVKVANLMLEILLQIFYPVPDFYLDKYFQNFIVRERIHKYICRPILSLS